MTKYDLWLKAHGGGFFGPGYYEPSYEFSRPTHDQFKNDLRELIACYPDGKPDDFDEQSLDTVWQTVSELRITSEHLEQTDVPAEIVDGTTQPLFELGHLRIFSDGYAQYMAYTIGGDVEGGFRLLWRRDRFHLNRDYRIDEEGHICAVKLPMLAACAGALNPKLAAAIKDIVGPIVWREQPTAKPSPANSEAGTEQTGPEKQPSNTNAPGSAAAHWIAATDQIAQRLVAKNPRLAVDKETLAKRVHKELETQFKKTGDKSLAKRGGKTVASSDTIKRWGLPSYGHLYAKK